MQVCQKLLAPRRIGPAVAIVRITDPGESAHAVIGSRETPAVAAVRRTTLCSGIVSSYSCRMWSGRALVLLSLASVVAALIAAIAAGWIYGLGLYVASVILFGLLLVRMIREQRRRSGRSPPSADLT
jgi:uncharacterized membrane protein YfcA